MKIKKDWKWISLTFLVVWLIQNSFLFFAQQMHEEESGEFSSFVYKGPFSYCDVLTYAGQIRYSSDHPSLLRSDALIKENEGLLFADGNIINVYSGWINQLVDDIDLTPIVGSILPLLLSVLLLFKISRLILKEHFKYWLAFGLSVLVLLTNFDDLFGLWKLISGYFLNLPEADDIIPVGYNQRFPYGQFSNFIFIYWIYSILMWRQKPSLKNQLVVAFSLLLGHYTYFYYWSYALPISFGLVLFKFPKWKDYYVLLIAYCLGSAYYWSNFLDFNSTHFAVEYLERVKGPQMYSFTGILIVGLISGWSVIIKNFKVGLITYLLPFLAIFLLQREVNYFSNDSTIHFLFVASLCLVLITSLVYCRIKVGLTDVELLNLFNYYLMVILNALVFIIGYNVQPYHWVFTTYYIVLVICLIFLLKPYLNFQICKRIVVILSILVIVIGGFNSYRFAKRNSPYWSLSSDDLEVIRFFKELPEKPVVGSNNIMPLITFSGHSDLYLFTGSTSHSRSLYKELYYRFIQNYKLLGLSDDEILSIYESYKGHKDYWAIYHAEESESRSDLAREWPKNLTLAAEALHHYFINFDSKKEDLIDALRSFNENDYSFELNYMLVQKGMKFQRSIKAQKVLENDTFIIYTLN